MAQKKWQLKEEDYDFAYNYIMRVLKDDKFFRHLGPVCSLHYEIALENLDILSDNYENGVLTPLEALNFFIYLSFDDIQIRKLRVSLRVNKSLKKNPKKQVSLDLETYYRLLSYANINNMTLLQAIDSLLLEHKKRDFPPQS